MSSPRSSASNSPSNNKENVPPTTPHHTRIASVPTVPPIVPTSATPTRSIQNNPPHALGHRRLLSFPSSSHSHYPRPMSSRIGLQMADATRLETAAAQAEQPPQMGPGHTEAFQTSDRRDVKRRKAGEHEGDMGNGGEGSGNGCGDEGGKKAAGGNNDLDEPGGDGNVQSGRPPWGSTDSGVSGCGD